MIGIAGGIAFVGYWLAAYGLSQLRGCNAGFFAIGWPGSKSFTGCNPDPSSASSTNSGKTLIDQGTSGLSASKVNANRTKAATGPATPHK